MSGQAFDDALIVDTDRTLRQRFARLRLLAYAESFRMLGAEKITNTMEMFIKFAFP